MSIPDYVRLNDANSGPFCLPDLSHFDYLSIERASSTFLKNVLRSPLHARNCVIKPTPAMEYGTLVHWMIEHLDDWPDLVAVAPAVDRRTKAGKLAEQEFKDANANKVILTDQQFEALAVTSKNIRSHKFLSTILQKCKLESSIFFDGPYDVKCKTRPDALAYDKRIILDWKTTQDASPDAFKRSASSFKYHVQAALYLDSMSALTDEVWSQFVLVAIESVYPYGIALYQLDEASISKGRTLYTDACLTLADCQGQWPSYTEEIQSLTVWGAYD